MERNMRRLVFPLLFVTVSVCSVAQQTTQPDQGKRQDGVVQRGDHVMGFSHDATTHHFHLLKDGGEIVVTANDPMDKTSIKEIWTHLNHIVGMFSNGNLDAPMLIHGTNPPGVATMTRLKSDIRYSVSEVPNGAMIRIKTSNPETTDAVRVFAFSNR